MAATITVACPKCKKTIQAPEAFKGKRIKCKGCGQAFAIPGQAASSAKTPASTKKGEDEEWGKIQSYGVTRESDMPRCPYCAWELEDRDAIICLHCGYNLQTRERLEEKVLEPVTGGDYFLWLLPGIACVLLALFFVGVIVTLWTGVPDLSIVWLGWVQEWEWTRVYGTVVCGFIIWFLGFFAVKRLILNPRPPERQKKLKKEEEED